MTLTIDKPAFRQTLTNARQHLIDQLHPDGCWPGHLSSSALSTATAVTALHCVDPHQHSTLIHNSLQWLADHQNPDGGYGDTTISNSNLSTSTLCRAAFTACPSHPGKFQSTITKIDSYLTQNVGSLAPAALADAITAGYGRDRTFSVPILTMAAVSSLLGPPETAWPLVKPLPFELAAVPHRLLKWLQLPVVSYALPALIAIGHARFHNAPPRNPITRLARYLTRQKTLNLLQNIQPLSGGFLEAAPLTSFVAISLTAADQSQHPVTQNAIRFLTSTVRPDGSWPIDTNLATWLTSLSVNALAESDNFHDDLNTHQRQTITEWLLNQQFQKEHPYTHAAPGGFSWTNLPGAVPDADDTAAALLALHNLDPDHPQTRSAAPAALNWLINLQNRDGGIPTFCRGWGKLPFDRSCPDLTAHAISAWSTWLDQAPPPLQSRLKTATRRALAFLARTQYPDGYWKPLWFGNQHAPDHSNPTYGTAKVLTALSNQSTTNYPNLHHAANWLLSIQNPDGGFGGHLHTPSTIEETALATDALVCYLKHLNQQQSKTSNMLIPPEKIHSALNRSLDWLIQNTNRGQAFSPSPIGLYFAKLWYHESLYPTIFTITALEKIKNILT
ncbi:MAG: hypothetical protein JXD22_09320 [Sedimentisphaerales bacterium]|nr:hypothetical protein [Sedimentisphaerales bacterium]